MAKWKDHEQVAKENNIGGGGYYRIEVGDNKVRILSEFEPVGKHYVVKEKKSYVCIGKDDDCPYCNMPDSEVNTSVKFLLWILDRKDDEVKLAEFGYSIIKQIGNLASSEDWGFDTIPDYDVIIKRTGEGLDTEYSVMPSRSKEEVDENILKDKQPIKEIIDKMKEKAGGSPSEIQVENDDSEISVKDLPF